MSILKHYLNLKHKNFNGVLFHQRQNRREMKNWDCLREEVVKTDLSYHGAHKISRLRDHK